MKALFACLAALCLSLSQAASEERVDRLSVHTDWSVFCDDICWVVTRTHDFEWLVMVTLWDPTTTELSVMREDTAPLRPSAITLEVACLTDALAIAEGVAYTSRRDRDPAVLAAFQGASFGQLLPQGGKPRSFSLAGFPQALAAAGYKAPPGLPVPQSTQNCPAGA